MSRPVAIRVSWRDDAGYLLRLQAAVLKDGQQTEAWRETTAEMIRQLAMRLLEADAQKPKRVIKPKRASASGGSSESLKVVE